MKYPIYRKFQNGKEFMKLNESGEIILVKLSHFLNSEKNFSIVHSNNPLMREDFFNPEISMESSWDEFAKVYDAAFFQLNKTNVYQ